MTTPSHARAEPGTPPAVNAREHLPAPSKVGTPARTLALCLGSIAVMAPWPVLGILLVRSLFDRDSEAFLLFGGVTMFPLMILALFGSVAEEVFIVAMMVVWLAAAAVPDLWLRRRLRTWTAVGVLLGVQSAFSLAQAAMGALLIVGKNV